MSVFYCFSTGTLILGSVPIAHCQRGLQIVYLLLQTGAEACTSNLPSVLAESVPAGLVAFMQMYSVNFSWPVS